MLEKGLLVKVIFGVANVCVCFFSLFHKVAFAVFTFDLQNDTGFLPQYDNTEMIPVYDPYW